MSVYRDNMYMKCDRNFENRVARRNGQARNASLAKTLHDSGIAERARSPSGSAIPHAYRVMNGSGANDTSLPLTSNPAYVALTSRISSSKSENNQQLAANETAGAPEGTEETVDISNSISDDHANAKNLPAASVKALVGAGVLSDELSVIAYDMSFEDELIQDKQLIDHSVFDQLLEMDDDDEHEFSKSIVWNYFEQAETTIADLQKALEAKDLKKLSSLGHFLKGSSAVLGLTKMRKVCERIQNYGSLRSRDGVMKLPSEEIALDLISKSLSVVNDFYKDARAYLLDFYEKNSST